MIGLGLSSWSPQSYANIRDSRRHSPVGWRSLDHATDVQRTRHILDSHSGVRCFSCRPGFVFSLWRLWSIIPGFPVWLRLDPMNHTKAFLRIKRKEVSRRGLLATILVPVGNLAESSRTFRIPASFIFPNRCRITVAVRRHAQTRGFLARCIT